MNERSRPRLLFLCQTLPYPPDSGVLIRTYNVLRLLSREFEITALCFFRTADRATPAEVRRSVEGLRELAHVEVFPIPQEHSRWRLVADHLRSIVQRRAYTVFAYESRPFRRRLTELLQGDYDVVHVDSLDLAAYLPAISHLPVVCVHHNVESALLARRAGTRRAVAGAYFALQAKLTAGEERTWCPKVALNVMVSDDDRALLERMVPTARFAVVPNGVDTQVFRPGSGDDASLVFVGAYSWEPNRDAMQFFCTEVLPILRSRGIEVPITWIGRAPDGIKREYFECYGVCLTGYVDDIRPLVGSAACYIAPLRAGGGTRLKILDAWAMGKAVVSTSIGCEGLAAADGVNIFIRDTASAFADAVEMILRDHDVRRRVSAAARQTAEDVYDWEVIGRSMMDEYRQVLALQR